MKRVGEVEAISMMIERDKNGACLGEFNIREF